MDFDYLWEDGPQLKKTEGFKLSTDSVLLGNFVNCSGCKKAVDLGCASGILTILIACRNSNISAIGVEIDEKEAENANENIVRNELDDRCSIVCADLRQYKELFKSGSFDIVVSNPPYFPLNSGPQSPNADRARARGEGTCTLSDICEAAGYLCRYGGKVALVHKPERLAELFSSMRDNGIEPKRLRLVFKDEDSVPSLVLVEGRRGGSPGLRIEKNLYLFNKDGSDSDEIKEIYHRY